MRVERVTTGRVRPKRASRGPLRYLPGGWSDSTLPVNAFVLWHPAGICVFDTGMSLAAARALPRHPFLRLARFELSPEDELGARLRALAVDPGDVQWVVLSHLHVDHIAGAGVFPVDRLIVSRTEWERAAGLSGRLRGYVPASLPHGDPLVLDLDGPPVGPFAGSFDLAGDGRLVVVPTPGHTSGHLSLISRDVDGGYFLGGDVAQSAAELPAPLGEYCTRERLTVLLAHDEHP